MSKVQEVAIEQLIAKAKKMREKQARDE